MNRPPITNQLTVNDPDNKEACGESCDAMLSQELGVNVSAAQEIANLRARYGESGVQNGTSVQENETLLEGEGLEIRAIVDLVNVPAAINNGSYAMMLIHDDAYANPNPAGPYEHFIIGYRVNNNGTVQCVNPWGGRDIAYATATLEGALIAAIAITPKQEEDMNSTTVATALVRLAAKSEVTVYQGCEQDLAKALDANDNGTAVNDVFAKVTAAPAGTQAQIQAMVNAAVEAAVANLKITD